MKKVVLFLSLAIALVSCKTFNGTLSNTEDLVLNAKKGTVKLAAGERKIKITFKSKKKAELEVAGKKIDLKFSNDLNIPDNGNFKILSKNWNQNYDMVGASQTSVAIGPLSHDFESCVERIPHTVCDRNGVCHVVYSDFHGTRQVEYRLKTTTQSLEIDLERDGQFFGKMNGDNARAERMYEYIGVCRI